jgi:hypothetical protein
MAVDRAQNRRPPAANPVVHWTSRGRSLAYRGHHVRRRGQSGSTPVRLFNLSQVKKTPPQLGSAGPKHRCCRLNRATCNHSGRLGVVSQLQQRMAVVGTTDVGNQTDKQTPLKAERPRICGAMSEQRGDSGNQSAPQKFVQLVGCRDPKARLKPWVRPRPAPVER